MGVDCVHRQEIKAELVVRKNRRIAAAGERRWLHERGNERGNDHDKIFRTIVHDRV